VEELGGRRAAASENPARRTNLESRDRGATYEEFLDRFPEYAQTAELDELRRTEYERLDRLGHVYLDYTGGGLYAERQLRQHRELLGESVLGNPHSHNPASQASTELVERAREDVHRFFNADRREYEIIFVPNASGALKLVGEAYPFGRHAGLLLTFDNHNSVNGIREFAHRRGATATYVPVRNPDLRVDCELLHQALLESRSPGSTSAPTRGLFAYPAQSNFSGVQHPLSWVKDARAQGWDVILDCAAYVPTNHLDLRRVGADFVPISFYKMFGYPTGIGALIARREALSRLQRPWFAGGTITIASVQNEDWYRLAPAPAGFEDGTLDYLGLPAVSIGLRYLQSIGMDTIHTRVSCLTGWLIDELLRLRHSNGHPLVRIFGPQNMQGRGATIALHLLDPRGRPYDVYGIETAAGREFISIRTGCFCNPGDGEVAHEITSGDMEPCFRDGTPIVSLTQCQRTIEDATGKVPNTIRVSLGLVSNFADVHRFVAFTGRYRDRLEGR
jgi:molybdenum cofactor sulfurtransferase